MKQILSRIAFIAFTVANYGCTSLSNQLVAEPELAVDAGDLVFECSGEEPFWSFRAEPNKLVWKEPGPDGIIEQVSSGAWRIFDDTAGNYYWAYEDSDKDIVIIREQCIAVSGEILTYRLKRRDMPEGCCRRFLG